MFFTKALMELSMSVADNTFKSNKSLTIENNAIF